MRKKFLILMIFILILAGIFVLKSRFQKRYDYEIEQIKEYHYYIYQNEGKYGVINEKGETIIEAKYSNVMIPNPEKDIFVCYQNEMIEILNSKQEKIFTQYEKVEPIKLKNVASTLTYEKSTLLYEQDGKYGLIDFNGKIVTKNNYDSIENLQPTEGKFLVSKDGKYGVIDLKGNILVKPEYDKIESDGYYTQKDGYQKIRIYCSK